MFTYKNDFDYNPHATIAYVQSGLGESFTNELKEPISFKLKSIVYSNHLREKIIIKEFN